MPRSPTNSINASLPPIIPPPPNTGDPATSQSGNKIPKMSSTRMCDVIMEWVMPYIHDPRDRDAVSLVCRRWYELDSLTRTHVTIAVCYSTTPDRLRLRFRHLESLKLKGKPRASMFVDLIPKDWGGSVTPWVTVISESFECLKSLHFRRMIVEDSDLELLAATRGRILQVLKLDRCSGFSTDGLLHIGRSCRRLKTLFLEDSVINEKDGNWLHEIAINNIVLESLNFYQTELKTVQVEDLELIAKNCPNLVSVKINDCEILHLANFFQAASRLEEFCGGSFNVEPARYSRQLCRLGLSFMGKDEMPIVFPFATVLMKLDLFYASLDTEDHCVLIQKCPNLEVLEARTCIGDRGLEALASTCKRLKRLRIERGADDEGVVSQRGLVALAQGCLEIEYLAVYVYDITNAALEQIGVHSKKLNDFRLVLLEQNQTITDLPLDNGVRALLQGCENLKRFAFYLRPGGLSDVGLAYIGQYSKHVSWMLLGSVGESDEGLLAFSRGCRSLRKLEMRACCFSESALARAATQLVALRYLWVHGYKETSTGHHDLLAMVRPHWNIELIRARKVVSTNDAGEEVVVENPAHILAYYSLAGPRTDFPESVVPLVAA